MIGAVVIAAGASYRMGGPKALLKIGDKTFLHYIVDVLRLAGIREIVIVLGAEAENIGRTLSWFDGTVVVNEDWEQGQLTSVNCGLGALPQEDLEGAIVFPVDHPLISSDLIVSLVTAFRTSKKKIIAPVYKGQRGHPVLFSSEVFGELRKSDPAVGARQVVRAHANDVGEVTTDEEGVVLNIDTPEDYQSRITGRA
jgi:molybdenum cofactor cytidylyltransferase